MHLKSLHFFSGAPGFTDQSIHVGSEHCAGMVEAEEGIESPLFEFPLSCHARLSTLEGSVSGLREEL